MAHWPASKFKIVGLKKFAISAALRYLLFQASPQIPFIQSATSVCICKRKKMQMTEIPLNYNAGFQELSKKTI